MVLMYVPMQDGQERRSALNLVFSQVQGSREVNKLVCERIICIYRVIEEINMCKA